MIIEELLSLCQCPICKSELLITKDKTVIICQNQHSYPLMNSRVPVFLLNSIINQSVNKKKGDFKTSQSFSKQWQMYKEGDAIWGWNQDEFESLYLHMDGCGLKENEISQKLILDLGCGHGMYSYFFAEKGARVVGFDVSNGFLGLEERLRDKQKQKISFIQGDIANFPLKDGVFDYVWCSGVLHHTPNTKESFKRVHNVVKKGGRFYIWLYKPVFYTSFLTLIRKVTTKMPESFLVPLCYILTPFFAFTKIILNLVRLNYRQFEKRTFRENALSIHDTIAPPYRWHHTSEEVVKWFEEAGFNNIVITEESSLGFGIYADKC